MAKITLIEAETQLSTVQAAIQALISGKRLTQLRVGSGTFSRLYVFTEITLENLTAHRDELLAIIAVLDEELPVFKKNTTIPLVVGKDIY